MLKKKKKLCQEPRPGKSQDELLKLKYERYRLGSQLSLSLALLFPETEGGLQGHVIEHNIPFGKRQQGRTRAGPGLGLHCVL